MQQQLLASVVHARGAPLLSIFFMGCPQQPKRKSRKIKRDDERERGKNLAARIEVQLFFTHFRMQLEGAIAEERSNSKAARRAEVTPRFSLPDHNLIVAFARLRGKLEAFPAFPERMVRITALIRRAMARIIASKCGLTYLRG